MIPQTRKYHVIIVHFGGGAPTKTLVTQLLSGETSPDQVIVVDHAKKALRIESLAKVTIIRPEKNAGYGAGINLGLGMLAGRGTGREDIVVALNNDVQLQSDSLKKIKQWWEVHPDAKLAGVTMGQVNLLTGRAELSSKFNIPSSIFHLPYLDGACLTGPLSTFLALQGFPNAGFMYWEDVLLANRARQVGYNLSVIPHTGITHPTRRDAGLAGDQLYYLVRNGAIFLQQFSPRPWRYVWLIKNPLRLIYHSLHPAENSATVRQALWDAWRKKSGRRS